MSVSVTEKRSETGWLTTIVVVGVILTAIVFGSNPVTVVLHVSMG